MRLFITFFILFFSNLFLNVAQAAPHTPNSPPRKASVSSDGEHRKNKQAKKNGQKSPAPVKTKSKATDSAKANGATNNKIKVIHLAGHKQESPRSKMKNDTPALIKKNLKALHLKNEARYASSSRAKVKSGLKGAAEKELTLSEAHKKRYQHAKLTAMNKLMGQVGKPYHWGGSSPFTGFDCSGLVYYAYKDVVKIPIPRTANEMYHLRDAAPIKKSELESGDLVFFRINNRGAADHVGVYVGNGKFIQSPRTGSDIRISKLNEDYWQDHYVGARRVVTPQTIR
ncbi:C40 family peptidase [Brenneria populi]|uniref:C40 family peptidase n=1 Tax=Brenneria populi TaxID=1505588 RepID=A0ABU6JLB3_9GAMM|nr:C40 family peptidase [Brenneria populi Li et al. 2015]